MRKNFLITLFSMVLFIGTNAFAQVQIVGDVDLTPTLSESEKLPFPVTEAMWDVQLSFDVTTATGAAGNAGSEFDGTNLYTTRWGSNLIHRYDMSGSLLEQFSIGGVSGLRDLAYDGNHMYGGAAGSTIYEMDFISKTLIGTINVGASGNSVRFIAYDSDNDGFWIGTWADSPKLVSRTGTVLATINTGLAGQYGAAYDNVSAGGPYLWMFDQGAGAGTPQYIIQYDIASGTATGVVHDVTSDVGLGNSSAIAGGLFSTSDYVSGYFSIGGLLQGTPDMYFIYEIAETGPPIGPGPATDPIPASGTTGVSVTIPDLMWTNPAGATSCDVYFGDDPGSMALIHTGSLVNMVSVPGTPLNYATSYYWKVNELDGSGTTTGSTWNFTTEQDPNLVTLFFDDFESGLGNWTITNNGGTCDWDLFDIAIRLYTMPPAATGLALSADVDFCGPGTSINSSAVAGPFDATNYLRASVDFDNDFRILGADECIFDVSIDGGSSWMNVFHWTVDNRNTHEFYDISSLVAAQEFYIRLTSIQPDWDWWWAVDNMMITVWDFIPVELTSFTAKANENEVVLNWSTATETNNQGFDIERKSNGQFEKVGYVAGFGTTTEVKTYIFTDKTVGSGNYTYRLKQVDFNGTFEYSPEVEVEVSAPKVYQLSQNYPNPFNPATTIDFSLAADSKVSLKIFDVIGQEVAQIVNGQMTSGQHTVNFDASSLNSGVYFYKIEANGVDGTSYSSVKKMILTK